MPGELSLDPQRAISGGKDLSLAGTSLISLRNGTGAQIAAASEGQPWGRDDIGAQFQKNYGPLVTQFMDVFSQLGQFVEGLGDAAVQSVEDNLAADERASTTVVQAYKA